MANGRSEVLNADVLGFQILTVNIPYSVAAGANFSTSLGDAIDAAMPQGYRFVSLAGFSLGNQRLALINLLYGPSQFSFFMSNVGTSQVSGTADIYVLIGKK